MEYIPIPVSGPSPHQRTPSSRNSRYHQSQTHSPDNQLHDHLPSFHGPNRSNTLPLSPVANHTHQFPQQQHQAIEFESCEQLLTSESAFNRILGEDVEVYVAEQADVYENVQKRWEEATLEEWVAGADGRSTCISASFLGNNLIS